MPSFSFTLINYFLLPTSDYQLYSHLTEPIFYLSSYFVWDFYELVAKEELFLLFSFLISCFFLSFSIFFLIRMIHHLMANDIPIRFILPSLFIFQCQILFLIFSVYLLVKFDFILIFHQ